MTHSPSSFSIHPEGRVQSKPPPPVQGNSHNAFRPRLLLILFTLLSLGITLFFSISKTVKTNRLSEFKEKRALTETAYNNATADQKTGMLAVSMLNELEGWARITPAPIQLLEQLSRLPEDLALKSIFLDRSFLYRPLPENMKSRFFKYSLSLAGSAIVELADSGNGQGKYAFPAFFDQTNTDLAFRFIIEVPEIYDEFSPRSPGQWRITSSLHTEKVWHDHLSESAASQ